MARLDRALRGLEHEAGPLPADRAHPGAGQDATAALLDQLRHLAGHLDVVHDAGLGHVDRPHRATVRLELAHLLRGAHLEPRETVGLPTLVDGLQARELARGGGHDDPAATPPLYAVGVAGLPHPARASRARSRLPRARRVVD